MREFHGLDKQNRVIRLLSLTSLDPRPKPEMTLPSILKGKGASGPASEPTMLGRSGMVKMRLLAMKVREGRFGSPECSYRPRVVVQTSS
jgi:hypothetical protein